jgi:hypothetical protein
LAKTSLVAETGTRHPTKETAMITGAHSILYSRNPDADRALLRDVLGLPHVDVGGGWLIFGLPPAEVAVHPSDSNDVHELYFMCDDIEAFAREMAARNIACGPVLNRGWGLLVEMALPGGGKIGVYEPRHARPPSAKVAKPKKPAKRASRKAAPKKAAKKAVAKKAVAKKRTARNSASKAATKRSANKARKR